MTRAAPAVAGRRASPFRLNLEQQRKRAKELLRAWRAGDSHALRRVRLYHPAPLSPALAAAQLVIARELGLASWPRLLRHIEASDLEWSRIAAGLPAPDRDGATLHLRCGSDIGGTLREAGFAGDFLEYSDPFCQGPVLDRPDWLERRADFIAGAYGAGSGISRAEVAAKLAAAEAALRRAAQDYERVVLWFEHDSYDQLILARCLAHFAAAAPRRLELISPGRYPGSMRFIGLGQLPPEALRLLWDEARQPVTRTMLEAGEVAWAALRRPDPSALAALAGGPMPALPQLARALRRHCQELPWSGSGLGLTQRLVLELLTEQPRTVGELFRDLMMEREPLPWLGDLMFHAIVEAMKQVRAPLFDVEPAAEWPQERLTITPLGRAVLAGEVDYLSLEPPPRWLGGVEIAGRTAWRWDEAAGGVLRA